MKAGAAGLGGLAALALLLPMEAGVPIPLPADLVMFSVGERVAAGTFPLWLAVIGFEVISVLGTTALFLACRGPGHLVIARFGPRLGLTQARVRRSADFAEARGLPALAVGRGMPGLRTLTVVAAGASRLSKRRALPALILGSSVFLQLHLVLGLLLGPLADRAFDRAKAPAIAILAVAAHRRAGVLAGQAGEDKSTRSLGRGGLPGLHRLEPNRRADAGRGRAHHAGSSRLKTRGRP